jgi:GTPase SAR1 family protein
MENESSLSTKSSISNRYETIVIGDAYCGKTSYLLALAEHERKMNMPIHVSQDKSEYEFCVENKSKKIIFAVKDTASMFN